MVACRDSSLLPVMLCTAGYFEGPIGTTDTSSSCSPIAPFSVY
jgi:hypothetical protein